MRYTKNPGPLNNNISASRRIITGSIPKYLPSPPQTPATIRSERERYNLFSISIAYHRYGNTVRLTIAKDQLTSWVVAEICPTTSGAPFYVRPPGCNICHMNRRIAFRGIIVCDQSFIYPSYERLLPQFLSSKDTNDHL